MPCVEKVHKCTLLKSLWREAVMAWALKFGRQIGGGAPSSVLLRLSRRHKNNCQVGKRPQRDSKEHFVAPASAAPATSLFFCVSVCATCIRGWVLENKAALSKWVRSLLIPATLSLYRKWSVGRRDACRRRRREKRAKYSNSRLSHAAPNKSTFPPTRRMPGSVLFSPPAHKRELFGLLARFLHVCADIPFLLACNAVLRSG